MFAATSSGLLQDPSFWVAVAFFAFVGFLVFLKVPAVVTSSLDARADGIRSELAEARRLREDAEKLLADYKAKGAAAEAEARIIVENAKREAESIAAEAQKSLAESLERRTKQAADKIKRAEAQAVAEVRGLAVDKAVAAAEKIMRDQVAAGAGQSFIADGIKQVRGNLG